MVDAGKRHIKAAKRLMWARMKVLIKNARASKTAHGAMDKVMPLFARDIAGRVHDDETEMYKFFMLCLGCNIKHAARCVELDQ